MVLKDISFETPEDNILYDEVLLELAEQNGREFLRFWESKAPFVVLGKIGQLQDDLWIDGILRDRVPVLRRSSGGGTVVQGKGCLNYSLVLSKEIRPQIQALQKSYQYILGKVIEAFQELGVQAFFRPISDIAVKAGSDFKKISGNAQKRGRQCILHHGTVLYDFDFSLAERYLKMPKSTPEYRNGRLHRDFLANIGKPKERIMEAVSKVFDIQQKESTIQNNEQACLKTLREHRNVVVALKDLSALVSQN